VGQGFSPARAPWGRASALPGQGFVGQGFSPAGPRVRGAGLQPCPPAASRTSSAKRRLYHSCPCVRATGRPPAARLRRTLEGARNRPRVESASAWNLSRRRGSSAAGGGSSSTGALVRFKRVRWGAGRSVRVGGADDDSRLRGRARRGLARARADRRRGPRGARSGPRLAAEARDAHARRGGGADARPCGDLAGPAFARGHARARARARTAVRVVGAALRSGLPRGESRGGAARPPCLLR